MLKILSLATLIPSLAFAANMTNDIKGVGPNGSLKPIICIQDANGSVTYELAPGKSVDANKMAKNLDYVGATIRFNGCNPIKDAFLGYVGFSLSDKGNNAVKEYFPPEGVPVAFNNRAIDSKGHVTGAIEYLPIETNPTLEKAKDEDPKHWKFVGINLAGLEFDKTLNPINVPNLSLKDKGEENSDLVDTEEFIKGGINTIRVPLSWSYLQWDGAGKGPINLAYYDNYVKPLLQTLTKAKVHTIVDLHAYMRYPIFGKEYTGCPPTGGCPKGPEGTLITDENVYKQVWGNLATLILNDPEIDRNYLMFDLMNEPVNVPDDKVFTIQAALIKMLRAQQFDGYILVEGNKWTGLHSWNESWQGANNQSYSNATLFSRENFKNHGIDDLSKIIINVHQYLDSDFSGTHDDCLQDLSSTGENGFNFKAFVDYLSTNKLKAMVTEFGTGKSAGSCTIPLTNFMNYLKNNAWTKEKDYGFIGWTIWSTGHGWRDYLLRVKPTPEYYQWTVLKGVIDN